MQKLLPALFFALLPTGAPRAQALAQPIEPVLPKAVVQTGIALQWFDDIYKSWVLSAEIPQSTFVSWGAQTNIFLPSYKETASFESTDFVKGFEIGGYMKYFLHGKLSGRRSGLYLGPELRWGVREFEAVFSNVFPAPPNVEPIPYQEKAFKVLLRWGIQWQFGHATLDISAPFGLERYKDDFPDGDPETASRAVMLPTLLLGYAF